MTSFDWQACFAVTISYITVRLPQFYSIKILLLTNNKNKNKLSRDFSLSFKISVLLIPTTNCVYVAIGPTRIKYDEVTMYIVLEHKIGNLYLHLFT